MSLPQSQRHRLALGRAGPPLEFSPGLPCPWVVSELGADSLPLTSPGLEETASHSHLTEENVDTWEKWGEGENVLPSPVSFAPVSCLISSNQEALWQLPRPSGLSRLSGLF